MIKLIYIFIILISICIFLQIKLIKSNDEKKIMVLKNGSNTEECIKLYYEPQDLTVSEDEIVQLLEKLLCK